MRQAQQKSKGPIVKLEQIDRLTARIRREQKRLEDTPHPHPPLQPRPGRAITVMGGGCPSDCPIQTRERQLYKLLGRLGKLQRVVLVELARSRARARRVPAVTLEMYEQARARVDASGSKHPRAELARQLGLSRQGLLAWESQHLRER